jgi:hypothetical protein
MAHEVYGPPRPAALAGKTAPQANDVVCVAGCTGRPGQVVQRISGLPPSEKVKLPHKRRDEQKRNEPLDINP